MKVPAKACSHPIYGTLLLAGLVADEAELRQGNSSFSSGQGAGGKHRNSIEMAGALVACLLLTIFSGVTRADEPVYDLDIPAMNAAEALNRFAEQTGAIMLFPYDLASARQANAVTGRYTLLKGLNLLLQGTGLSGGLSDKRVVSISPAENEQRLEENDAMTGQDVSLGRKLGAFVASLFTASVASGQDADAGGSSYQAVLEEIIVTAQKREQPLMEVPISMAVVSAEEIARRGLVSAEDYLRGIPGVNQVTSLGGQSIVIRGIESSPRDQNLYSGSTVATYFGETPTTNSAGLGGGTNVDLKLVDIDRVEVLRGPQGTAFGNSSMGGAVRIIPVAPKADRFEGRMYAGYSVTSGTGGDNYNLQAVGNIPLVKDALAIRLVGYQYQDSGFYRNLAGSDAAFQAAVVTPFGAEDSAVDEEEVGSYYAIGGRGALLFQASDELRFTLNYLSQQTETDGVPVANSGTYEHTLLRVAPEHTIRGQTGGLFDTEIDIVNPMIEYDFGWADLLATYSYVSSGSILALPFGAYGTTDFPVSFTGDSDHRENVGEIRLATRLDGEWNFLAGLYAEELEDEILYDYLWHGDPAANFFGPEPFLGSYLDSRNLKQTAAFGEASWEFSRDFTFAAGARAYDYERTGRLDTAGALFGDAVTIVEADASGTSFRANLSYTPNDNALVYAGWSQGFRLGKPQPGLPAGVCDLDGDGVVDGTDITIESTTSVESDDVDSYELGGKFALLDRRLTLTANVFRMEWTGMPVIVGATCGAVSLGYNTNAGEALSEGVEVQTNFYATDALRIDVGGSWIDAKLTEDVPTQGFFDGDRLPGSPEVNANLSVQYEFEIGGYGAFVRADSIYVGSFYGDTQESPATESGDYVEVDLSARVTIENVNIDLYVRNLTDEDAFTFRGISAISGEFNGYRLRPRTFGLRLGYAFD